MNDDKPKTDDAEIPIEERHVVEGEYPSFFDDDLPVELEGVEYKELTGITANALLLEAKSVVTIHDTIEIIAPYDFTVNDTMLELVSGDGRVSAYGVCVRQVVAMDKLVSRTKDGTPIDVMGKESLMRYWNRGTEVRENFSFEIDVYWVVSNQSDKNVVNDTQIKATLKVREGIKTPDGSDIFIGPECEKEPRTNLDRYGEFVTGCRFVELLDAIEEGAADVKLDEDPFPIADLYSLMADLERIPRYKESMKIPLNKGLEKTAGDCSAALQVLLEEESHALGIVNFGELWDDADDLDDGDDEDDGDDGDDSADPDCQFEENE